MNATTVDTRPLAPASRPMSWAWAGPLLRPGRAVSSLRTEIMGLCILAIAVYHAPLALAPTLANLKELGFLGVDVFFYLSGLGLMCSRQRQPRSYGAFMAKRLRRVVPGYMAVTCGLFLVTSALRGWPAGSLALRDVLLSFAMLDYLVLRDPQFWFASAILLCYAAFPAYGAAFQAARSKERFTALACAAAMLLAAGLSLWPPAGHLLVFAWRVPAFLLGVHAGWSLTAQGSAPEGQGRFMPWLMGGLALFGLMLAATSEAQRWRYGLWWMPFVAMAPVAGHLLASLAARLGRAQAMRPALRPGMRFLRFCGRHSYEIYLLHIALFDLFAGPRPLLTTFQGPLWSGLALGPQSPLLHLLLLTTALLLAPALQRLSGPPTTQAIAEACGAGERRGE